MPDFLKEMWLADFHSLLTYRASTDIIHTFIHPDIFPQTDGRYRIHSPLRRHGQLQRSGYASGRRYRGNTGVCSLPVVLRWRRQGW